MYLQPPLQRVVKFITIVHRECVEKEWITGEGVEEMSEGSHKDIRKKEIKHRGEKAAPRKPKIENVSKRERVVSHDGHEREGTWGGVAG